MVLDLVLTDAFQDLFVHAHQGVLEIVLALLDQLLRLGVLIVVLPVVLVLDVYIVDLIFVLLRLTFVH